MPGVGAAKADQAAQAKSPSAPAKELKETPAPGAGKPGSAKRDPAGPATRDTTVLGKVDTDGPTRRVAAGAPTLSGPAKTAAESSAMRDSVSDAGETGQMPVVGTDRFDDADGADVDVDDRGLIDSDDSSEDEQVSMGAVLLMSVVGIVLGILVFLGFDLLWGRFNSVIVGLLALAVTGVMVAVVHALRTSRDGLSMVLAGVVGLVMTFGPLAIMVL